MAKNDRLRPLDRLANVGRQRLPLIVALVALTSTVGLIAGATLLGRAGEQPAFLTDALGSADASAPLVRHPAKNVRVKLDRTGVAVARGTQSVRLEPLVRPTENWERFDGGVSRSSALGRETITVDGERTEHFLTVQERVGARTLRWRLGTSLRARIGDDGAIAFLDGPVLTPLHITRPAIYDADGDDVTPKSTHWRLERRADETVLSLALDDAELPLPYVVDPAITYDATTEAAAAAANSNTVAVNRPAGVRQNDVIVVTLSHRLGSSGSVTTVPAAWSLLTTDDNNTQNELDTYWHRVGPIGSEPASYSWVLSGTTQWVVGAAAFSGIDSIAPVDVQNGAYNNTTTNVVPSAAIAGVDAGSVVIGQYSLAGGRAGTVDWTSGGGWNEVFDHQSANGTVANRATAAMYYTLQAAAGSSVAHTATCTGCTFARNIGVQSALKYDATPPANVALTGVPSTSRGTLSLTGVATESESSLDIVFQRSPAGAGTWTTIATATAAPYVTTFDTTTVADASYDFRIIATNGAGDSTTSPIVTARIVNGLTAANTLLVGELTGGAFQHYVQATSTHYYNSLGGAGTFSLESIPQNMPKGITFVGASSNSNRDGSPLHLSNPGVFAGDVLLAAIGVEGGFGNVTPPAGWTAVTSLNNGATYGQIVYRRTATAAEPAYYTFTHASAVANLSGGIVAYRGVSSATPVDVTANQANASGTNVVAPTVTTTTGCARLVGLFSSFAPSSMTAPAGMTERFDVVTNEPAWDINVVATDEIRNTPGVTGPRTATASAAGVNIGALVALRANECAVGVSFPTPSQTGFTGGGNIDTSDPWFATAYAFDGTNTTQPGAKPVSTVDHANAPLQSTTITFVRDVSPPAGGALTVNGTAATALGTASDAGATFSIARTDYTETQGAAGAGLASSTLTRDSAAYSNGACAAYSGSPVTIVGNPNQTLGTGCYRYVLTGLDNVGNTVSVTTDVRVHGAPTQVTVTGSTASLTSGTTRVLTATIKDAAGNVAVTDSTTVVTFGKQSGAGTVSGTGAATVTNGVATQTITGVLAGSVVMQATGTGLTTGTLGAFTIVHSAATQIALSGSTANLASGTTRVLTATIQDAAGNTVTADNSTVVSFAKQSGAGTLSGTGTATAASGVATKTITGQLIGGVTMEATATGLTTGTVGAFTVVHGAASQIALTGSTGNLASGTTRVLTATLLDAAGNTVTSDNSTVVSFAKQSGAGTLTGTGTATAASGVATKTITGVLAGSVTMEATATGLTTGTLGSFTVVHGAASQIALTGSTANLASGTTRVLTATIQDAAGNTVTSENSTVVSFAKQSGAGTVGGTGAATVSGGVATKTLTGVLAGSITMEATATGLTSGTLAAFTIVHGTASQIQLTESGPTASGANHTLTATIQDAAGNTVAGDSASVVTFAKTAGAGTVTGLGSSTASNGVATKVVVNAASGLIFLDAQAAGLTTGTANYTIAVGSASTSTSVILASPTSIVADGSNSIAITVRLKDAAGNNLTGSGGTVALSLTGSGSLSGVTDNGDGTYSATLTAPTTAGTATVSGTLNAAALAATAGATYTHGPATQIALAESGSNVAGNAHTLTATIQDANGNTVTSDSSSSITFVKTGGPGTVTGLGSATASNGVATKNVTNRLAGQIDLAAQAAGLTAGTASYTITIGPVSPAASDSTVVTAPPAVYANGVDAATITVTLRDTSGNGVPGKTVTLAQGSGSSTISGGGATNASGVVTFSVASATVETVAYTATDTTDALTLLDDVSVDFTFQDGTAPTNAITLTGATRALLSGTTLYYNGSSGGSFTLSSAVADGGSGPGSATYPLLAQVGWTHNAETVSTPAAGPYVSSTFTFAPGSSGNFAYDVTGSDAWAPPNTVQTTLNVTEDSTAPAASISCNGAACAAGWYTASPVSVTLAAPDGGAGLDQIRYTTDGTDPTILTGSVYGSAFDIAAQGLTTVKFRAFDRVGNDTGVQTQTIRIDTIVPNTTIDSSPAAATQDTTPTFAFGSTEAGSTFQVRLNGGLWTSQTSPLTFGSLAESTYTFEVRATDAAGNIDATPASFTFTVDTTSANTTITSSPPTASNSTSASFSFIASDAGPGFECRLDGAAFSDCSSPRSYTSLTETTHTFEVRAEDAAGNLDATPASHTWTVDLTAPNTSFLSTPADPSANATPTFGLASTEPSSTFECDLDGSGWAPCAAPYTTPALGDGSHTLTTRATDAAGNTDATEVTYTWLVDATAPTGSITSPANGAAVGGTIVLASNSADAGGSGVATVVFQRSPLGVGAWTNQPASWDTTAQADGDYDLRVVTTDDAGNSFTSPLITVIVDNTDPTLSVSAPTPVNLTTPDPAPITAIADDPGTGIASVNFEQCSETSATCTSDTWTPLGLDTTAPYGISWAIPSDGTRLIRVRATDGAGRQGTELVLATVDRTRPTGSLTAPVGGTNLRGTSVALTATASDAAPGTVNTVTFQHSPAGAGTWTDVGTDSASPYSASFDTTALADGLYDLRVFTTDTAGNAEATPVTAQVRIDNTLPTGSVTSPAAAANVHGTVALTSNSADPPASGSASGLDTVQFQRSPAGAGTWTNQAAAFDTTLVADGQYDLRVVTTDNAGNAFTSNATTIRVDNTLPTGSVTSPAAAANVHGTVALTSNSADPPASGSASGLDTVQFQRSPAGAGTWTNQAAAFDTTLVADGQYDLRVVTTDNAGNAFTSNATTIRVDNTLPTGDVTAPADGAGIGVAPVALTSNSADGGSGVATVVFERRSAGSGGAWTSIPPAWNTASGPDAVADGSYELRATTTDNAGNAFSSGFVTVLVDHTAPITSASLAPGSPSNAPVTVSFSAGDGSGSGVSATSYAVDGGTLQQGSAVVVGAPGDHSNDGSHTVQFFSTDQVGNIETPKTVTVVIDTTAPSGTGGDPGDYLRGIATLTYSTAATDVSAVQFEFSPAGAGSWSNVGGADIAPPYEASWNTGLVADGPYDLRAVVTDSTGNVATVLLPGLPKTVDNTAPGGSVDSPIAAAFVSGSVDVIATATDGSVPPASGVAAVRFEVKPAGAGAFTVFGTQAVPVAGMSYRQALATGSLPDGAAELRVVITDVAGNETTSATQTITVDNLSPTVTLNDPGAAVSGTIALGATTAPDTAVIVFERSPAGAGSWAVIGTDATPVDGFLGSLDTTTLADGLYELRARATDFGGNSTTSATRTTRIDNTLPTGAVTAPGTGTTVGGPAVPLAATGTDAGGSGVATISFEVKPFGAGSFAAVGSDTTSPYAINWDSTSTPDGTAEIRALVTDAAGNSFTTAVIPVTIDSTGPSVTLADPGAVVSGTVGLSVTTGGGAVRVSFGVSPPGSGSWTEVGSDATAPFGSSFDTNTIADGVYDLRAVGYDAFGNASTPSVRANVRFDNVAPLLVASAPADGSVSTSANQIVLTASEPVTVPGALLDGVPAPAPATSGNQLTFATGNLAEGLHVLSGELEDASGNRTPFRVAVTIESTPQTDRPPVEKSGSPSGTTTLQAPGQLATLRFPGSAWPTLPGAKDFLVLRVDPAPPPAALASRLAADTQVIEVTARWALAGTDVHEFQDVLEVLLPQTAGTSGSPATSADRITWRTLQLLPGTTLPAGSADGFYRDAAGVHVLTRHLSYFAFFGDTQPPNPPTDVAGVIADDGLTLRWIPGTDDSGELGDVVLLVNGERYASFGPKQYEVKMGAFDAADTRVFTFLQYDAAGNVSVPSEALRAVPPVVGLGTEAAAARLAAAGFRLGQVTRIVAGGVAPGTVVGPAKHRLATVGSSIDVVASLAAPQAQFAFRIANDSSVKVRVGRLSGIPVRIVVTRPASGTATLATPFGRRLYTWHFQVKAGVTIKKLRLPSQVRRPGLYRLIWRARSGSATVSKAGRIQLVGPSLEQLRTRPHRVEVVLAVDISKGARSISSSADRVVSHATPERTFALLSAPNRNVQVVVVDVDRFGIRFLRDVRTVFPTVRAIALSDRPALRRALERAGAFSILPRSATRPQLNRALRRASANLTRR